MEFHFIITVARTDGGTAWRAGTTNLQPETKRSDVLIGLLRDLFPDDENPTVLFFDLAPNSMADMA